MRIKNFLESAKKIWNYFLDALFPKKESIASLEQEQWQSFRKILPRAGNELSAHNIFPLFDYRNPKVRAIVWDIKYKRNTRLAEALSKLMHEEMLESLADIELFEGSGPFLLIPIPMSAERRRERGFNQTELLASLIEKQSGAAFSYNPRLLEKIRHTSPQAELSRAERLDNLTGAYRVSDPESIRGKNIIVIDDVATTGSILREATRILKISGAREIIAFTIAH